MIRGCIRCLSVYLIVATSEGKPQKTSPIGLPLLTSSRSPVSTESSRLTTALTNNPSLSIVTTGSISVGDNARLGSKVLVRGHRNSVLQGSRYLAQSAYNEPIKVNLMRVCDLCDNILPIYLCFKIHILVHMLAHPSPCV